MNLPPGCSQSDIDRAMDGVVTCVECGVERASAGDDEQWTCRRCARPPQDDFTLTRDDG